MPPLYSPSSNKSRDELDVFRADRYYSDNIGSVSFRSIFVETDEIGASGRRRYSVDLPIGHHVSTSALNKHDSTKQKSAKKMRQPISPGKRLANMFHSFLYHSGFRKKVPTTNFDRQSLNEKNEVTRASCKFDPAKVTHSFSSEVGVKDEGHAFMARRSYMERDEMCGGDGIVVEKWTLNKRSEGIKVVGGGSYDSALRRKFARCEEFEDDDDDQDSESSSDLFDLPHYCLLEAKRNTSTV